MDELARLFQSRYLINLPERADRLRASKRELKRIGWDADSGGVEIFPALRFTERAGFLNAGVRGCFHSHLECLRKAHRNGSSTVLILEDDVTFHNDFPGVKAVLLNKIRTFDWDFLYFAHEGTYEGRVASGPMQAERCEFKVWTNNVMTAACYAVHGRVLEKLVGHLEGLEHGPAGDDQFGPMSVDGAFNVFRRKHPDARCWISYPRLAWQRPSRSDLTPKAFDSILCLRPIVTSLRLVKYFLLSGTH